MNLIIFDWGRTLYDADNKELFPDTKVVLERLISRGYSLAIVALATAGQSKIDERKKIIQDEDLEKYFVSIKLDTQDKDKMYEETLRELEMSPEDVTIVDDRVIRGIKWGNAKGCRTVWVKNGKFAHELPTEKTGKPTHTIKNIGELLEYT